MDNIIQDLHHYCENNKWSLVSWSKDTNGLYILFMNKKGYLRFGFNPDYLVEAINKSKNRRINNEKGN
jgi:hypothetical protein